MTGVMFETMLVVPLGHGRARARADEVPSAVRALFCRASGVERAELYRQVDGIAGQCRAHAVDARTEAGAPWSASMSNSTAPSTPSARRHSRGACRTRGWARWRRTSRCPKGGRSDTTATGASTSRTTARSDDLSRPAPRHRRGHRRGDRAHAGGAAARGRRDGGARAPRRRGRPRRTARRLRAARRARGTSVLGVPPREDHDVRRPARRLARRHPRFVAALRSPRRGAAGAPATSNGRMTRAGRSGRITPPSRRATKTRARTRSTTPADGARAEAGGAAAKGAHWWQQPGRRRRPAEKAASCVALSRETNRAGFESSSPACSLPSALNPS